MTNRYHVYFDRHGTLTRMTLDSCDCATAFEMLKYNTRDTAINRVLAVCLEDDPFDLQWEQLLGAKRHD